MANKNGRTNFDNVLVMVREHPGSVFEKHARMLSDLSRERSERLRKVLAEMEDGPRSAFYRAMDESSLNSYEYNFAPIANIGIDDPEGDIRAASIHVLGFEDDRETGERILDAAQNDPDLRARIAAIEILGQYMFESAVENRIPVNKQRLQKVLADLIENRDEMVRRAAVVSYAVSEDERVKEIVSGYLAGNDREELIAGLTAVRHALGEDWDESVLELIRHDDEDVCREAIRAAGALQLREALPALYEIISRFDRIPPELLIVTAEAVAEIGDEGSLDVLETLGEAVVDMDEKITDAVDDCIDTLNMSYHMGLDLEDSNVKKKKMPEHMRRALQEAIEAAKDECLSVLEDKIPHDLEDDEPVDIVEADDDDHHSHHHHHHDNPLEGLDLSRFRILDDLETYEINADRDADEEELWAEFEDMAEEDLDADSLQDFINKLEKRKK